MPPNPPSNSRLPRLAVWSGYGTARAKTGILFIQCKVQANEKQGHPMDLFLKISALQANFCWLEDLEEIICSGKESFAGKNKDNCWCLRGIDV